MLPKDLSDVMKNTDIITSPELEQILDAVNYRWNNELHSHNFLNHCKNFREEFSWDKKYCSIFKG